MASLLQHMSDCRRFLGDDYEPIHRWLDNCFTQFGPYHRCERHHEEGVRLVRQMFGEEAAKAALIHILRDCRHIPKQSDYECGYVDALGLKKNWSTAAYIQYTDSDFEVLVSEFLRPTGLVLWAFLEWHDIRGFLNGLTTLSGSEIDELESQWIEARHRLMSSVVEKPYLSPFTPASERGEAAHEVTAYLNEALRRFSSARDDESGQQMAVGYVPLDALTNPLVYIDYELLEDLKPELSGASEIEIAKFAFPEMLTTAVTAVGDPGQHTITFVSRNKAMTVSNVRLRSTSEGTEVSYLVSSTASGIVVSDFNGRLVLRNGMHRAFLLAQLGQKEIPCLYIKEKNPVPIINSAYPVFSPSVLLSSRQPMLLDFLRPELCFQVPMLKTNKIVRVTAEEAILPIS